MVIDNEDLDKDQIKFVKTFYTTLERRLDKIRLPKEEWLNYIEGVKSSDAENDDIPF